MRYYIPLHYTILSYIYIPGLMGPEQRVEQRQRQQQLQQHREQHQQQQRLTRGAAARNREAILPII